MVEHAFLVDYYMRKFTGDPHKMASALASAMILGTQALPDADIFLQHRLSPQEVVTRLIERNPHTTLNDLKAITGLKLSTFQRWVREGRAPIFKTPAAAHHWQQIISMPRILPQHMALVMLYCAVQVMQRFAGESLWFVDAVEPFFGGRERPYMLNRRLWAAILDDRFLEIIPWSIQSPASLGQTDATFLPPERWPYLALSMGEHITVGEAREWLCLDDMFEGRENELLIKDKWQCIKQILNCD